MYRKLGSICGELLDKKITGIMGQEPGVGYGPDSPSHGVLNR